MSQTSGGLYERFFEEVVKPVDLEAGGRSSVRTSQTWGGSRRSRPSTASRYQHPSKAWSSVN
jgi:hypothetical protein